MIAGVRIGASNVETDVTATDRAVFPLARNVMTFEAVPPGHAPTRITLIAISGGNRNPLANAYARRGMTINWDSTP